MNASDTHAIVPAQTGWYVVTTFKKVDPRTLYHMPIIAWSIIEDKERKHYSRPILPSDEGLPHEYVLKSPDGKYMSFSYSEAINELTIYKDDAEALQVLIEAEECLKRLGIPY
jgi:hypothetical protein